MRQQNICRLFLPAPLSSSAEAYSQAQAVGNAAAFSQALAQANAVNAQACLGGSTANTAGVAAATNSR
jgi:hypothetical protein